MFLPCENSLLLRIIPHGPRSSMPELNLSRRHQPLVRRHTIFRPRAPPISAPLALLLSILSSAPRLRRWEGVYFLLLRGLQNIPLQHRRYNRLRSRRILRRRRRSRLLLTREGKHQISTFHRFPDRSLIPVPLLFRILHIWEGPSDIYLRHLHLGRRIFSHLLPQLYFIRTSSRIFLIAFNRLIYFSLPY